MVERLFFSEYTFFCTFRTHNVTWFKSVYNTFFQKIFCNKFKYTKICILYIIRNSTNLKIL
jgi:hypothetical protein